MTRPVVVLGAVVAALAVGLGTADATAGRPRAPETLVTAGSTTTVKQATVVCPDARGGVAQQVTWVRAAGSGSGVTEGQPTITATAVTSKPQDFANAGAEIGLIPYGLAFGGRIDKGTRALAFTGTGGSAVGLGAVQVTRATSGLSRGLAAVSCAEPGTAFTFVGGSTIVGNELKLVLTNIDNADAIVNLTLLGAKGPLNLTGASNGIEVKPHQRRSIDLVKLGPGEIALTAMVTAVTGRVAAAEITTRRDGDIPRGIEWIPDAGPASRRALVPGMTEDPGKKTLVLADPGTEAANVTVQVVSDTGTFTPAGLESVTVDPGSVTAVNVTSALAGHPGALLVTSDRPVAAAASQEVGSTTSPTTDVSWSAQTPTLNGTAVLPAVPLSSAAKRDVLVYFTAVHAAATITVTPTGQVDPTQSTPPQPVHVQVPAGQTVAADLAALLGTPDGNLAVEISSDQSGGPVTASAVFREAAADGTMAAQVGLVSVPGIIVLPSVREDPTVAGARPGEIHPSSAP
ncbi:MAG: hypothetical protein QOJ11_2457 [Frankiales bacterium]|nr:hypothetical protein [Frankiales bacterium]